MYRILLMMLLSFRLITAAPQEDSNITYIKKQMESTDPQPETKHSFRESRIEILPLNIPGNFYLNETAKDLNKSETKKREDPKNNPPLYNYSDRIYSIKSKPKKNNNTELAVSSDKPVNDADINNAVLDILPSESINNNILANKEISTVPYDTKRNDELITEKYDDEPTVIAEVVEETTKAPKFSPKLSHYGKSSLASLSQNLIKNSGKRRFRSRCRCEKIWNCAKIQITVPRCPDEYFLCCL